MIRAARKHDLGHFPVKQPTANSKVPPESQQQEDGYDKAQMKLELMS